MECNFARDLLPLYFDGELDRATSREFEAHLDGCADCRAALIELDSVRRSLRSDAPRFSAPQSLRERLRTHPQPSAGARPRNSHTRWLALAASWVLAFVAGGAVFSAWKTQDGGNQIARDLFASHWRALAATSPVDVVSTDRHTVKPWFAGKVAQAPVVQDFADQGFALVGGRIDYVGSERVPVLVYHHGHHLIDVFVLPQADAIDKQAQQQGYTLDPIILGSQPAVIVSDMDPSEFTRFKAMLVEAK
jgi:anti-sigma factor RsiW